MKTPPHSGLYYPTERLLGWTMEILPLEEQQRALAIYGTPSVGGAVHGVVGEGYREDCTPLQEIYCQPSMFFETFPVYDCVDTVAREWVNGCDNSIEVAYLARALGNHMGHMVTPNIFERECKGKRSRRLVETAASAERKRLSGEKMRDVAAIAADLMPGSGRPDVARFARAMKEEADLIRSDRGSFRSLLRLAAPVLDRKDPAFAELSDAALELQVFEPWMVPSVASREVLEPHLRRRWSTVTEEPRDMRRLNAELKPYIRQEMARAGVTLDAFQILARMSPMDVRGMTFREVLDLMTAL